MKAGMKQRERPWPTTLHALPYLIVLRDSLPIIHEEDLQCFGYIQLHLGPLAAIILSNPIGQHVSKPAHTTSPLRHITLYGTKRRPIMSIWDDPTTGTGYASVQGDEVVE